MTARHRRRADSMSSVLSKPTTGRACRTFDRLCDTETVVRGPSRRCWSGARAPAVSLSRNSVSLSVCHGGVYRWVLAQCVAVGELLGYARVSTTVQDPALEHDALRAAGCRWLWTDTASGSRSDRVKTGAARVLTEDVCVLGS